MNPFRKLQFLTLCAFPLMAGCGASSTPSAGQLPLATDADSVAPGVCTLTRDGYTLAWVQDNAQPRLMERSLFPAASDSVMQALGLTDGVPSTVSTFVLLGDGGTALFDTGLGLPDSRLQAGRFALNTGWLPEQVLDTLVNGQPVLFRVTVPEGLTWWQTAKVLEDAGLVRFEDFRAVITDPAFLRHYGIPFDSAEGFLMPDTYLLKKADVPDKAQARAVAGRMVDNFWRKGDALWPDGKRPSRDELRRLVILASVVEKETAFADERPRVAGVYANRLRINMALQADPTVIYGLGPNFDGNLRRRHLDDANNIYNTYQRPGLPPGPICSFGASALAAAITPEEHKYLYFVAITDGGRHAFSTNLDDHNRAVRQYLKNRRAQRQQ